MKMIVDDKKMENALSAAQIMNDAGYDVVLMRMDLSARRSKSEQDANDNAFFA